MASVSIIITTFNRVDALALTLERLDAQVGPNEVQVVVTDDGSTDGTTEMLESLELSVDLCLARNPANRGISAGRNRALEIATGDYLILLSDDLLVEPSFVRQHVDRLVAHPDAWIVGGFSQLEDLMVTPFGRFVDSLESTFEMARLTDEVEPGLWEMTSPTARNLSLPRPDLDRTGWFDEQFRSGCEDQDLAHRAKPLGIRFLYDASITCVHNDQAADLDRYCAQQERFAHDTVLLCEKRPEVHGVTPFHVVNGPVDPSDDLSVNLRRRAKAAVASDAGRTTMRKTISALESAGAPDPVLFRAYRLLIGAHIFRGWRAGLETAQAT